MVSLLLSPLASTLITGSPLASALLSPLASTTGSVMVSLLLTPLTSAFITGGRLQSLLHFLKSDISIRPAVGEPHSDG